MSLPNHPQAWGGPVLEAVMRSSAEDFVVDEIDAFEATGSGEHLLLTIEKRGTNTAFAAKTIAAWAGVPEMAVGYAGLKDRHAVTRQRFSVHLPKRVAPDIAMLESAGGQSDGIPSLRVVQHAWHAKKLPRGALAGNRFVLTLRHVSGDRDAIERRWDRIVSAGVPNYFGEQRFGRDGGNVDAALAMFEGRRMRREQRTMLLSAARSELFNRVLGARVADGSWDRGLDGEVWLLDGSRSVFGPEPWSDTLAARLAAFDIHPSAPLWGSGELRTQGAAREMEESQLQDDVAMRLRAGLASDGLRQERRATRLPVRDAVLRWPEPCVLQLSFQLPPGAYATTVLAALGDVRDVARAA